MKFDTNMTNQEDEKNKNLGNSHVSQMRNMRT